MAKQDEGHRRPAKRAVEPCPAVVEQKRSKGTGERDLFKETNRALERNYTRARVRVRSMSDDALGDVVGVDGDVEDEDEDDEKTHKVRDWRRKDPVATMAADHLRKRSSSRRRRRRDDNGDGDGDDKEEESDSDTDEDGTTTLVLSGLNAREADEILRLSSLKTSARGREGGGRRDGENEDQVVVDDDDDDDDLQKVATNAALEELKILGEATDEKLTQLDDLLGEEVYQ